MVPGARRPLSHHPLLEFVSCQMAFEVNVKTVFVSKRNKKRRPGSITCTPGLLCGGQLNIPSSHQTIPLQRGAAAALEPRWLSQCNTVFPNLKFQLFVYAHRCRGNSKVNGWEFRNPPQQRCLTDISLPSSGAIDDFWNKDTTHYERLSSVQLSAVSGHHCYIRGRPIG